MGNNGPMHLAPDTPAERELVAEVAQFMLRRTAPEELAVFEETAEEYFDDPAAVLDPQRKDEAVGFGLELSLLTPYALAVAAAVVRYLATLLRDALEDTAKPEIVRRVRRLFRGADDDAQPVGGQAEPDDPTTPAGLTNGGTPLASEQVRRVHDVAYDRATALGLLDAQARLLADAVVGRLVVAQ